MPPRPPTPPLSLLLYRAMRERCPRCGEGQVFEPGSIVGRDVCDVCNWRIERGPGHRLGGMELTSLLTFGVGLAVSFYGWWMFDSAIAGAVLGTVVATVTAVATYRRCRAMFFALDYLIDPAPDDSHDGPHPRDRERDPDDGPVPRPAGPHGRRAARPHGPAIPRREPAPCTAGRGEPRPHRPSVRPGHAPS